MALIVALTGGSGFVGSHVAEALVASGHTVRALVRRPESPGWLSGIPATRVTGDVGDPESLESLVRGADAVVHAAGLTSARTAEDYWRANADGTGHVAAAVRRFAPDAHVVLVSSQAAAGPSRNGHALRSDEEAHPVSAYGRSKLGGEEALKAAGVPFTILRPGAVYGPREKAIRDLFVAASRGFVPVLGGGKTRVQLAYAPDLACAVSKAVENGPSGKTFFAAHPDVLDYRAIARTLASLRTPPARLVPVPAALIRGAGAVAGWFFSTFSSGPPVFNSEKADEMLQPAWVCDVSDAQTALGTPFRTDFEEGARATYAWYREMGWLS